MTNECGAVVRRLSCAGGRIAAIDKASAAEGAGLRAGDLVVAVNGLPIRDVFDYQFYASDERLELRVHRGGSAGSRALEEITVSMPGGDEIGIRFAESTFDGIRRCRNRCPFCFVKQLPKGLRRSLYVRDDDYRYSVGYGSFVTLTNMKKEDWQRFAEQRLSPLRVSVHATEPGLRRRMLGKPDAPDVIEQLRRLGKLGVRAHTQLVLCPGINDGEHFTRSVVDLAALYPVVQSIAAVPVGLTKHTPDVGLRQFRPEEAAQIVEQASAYQRRYRHEQGAGLVYLGDEFYLLAGRKIPSGRSYDGYPQFENGVGLVRSLLDEWALLRRGRLPALPASSITVACGTRIASVWTDIAAWLGTVTPLRVEIVPVVNELFGPTVTVSGLLCGSDVVGSLAGRELGDAVVLPRSMFDSAGERTLDDLTPAHLEKALGRPVLLAGTLRELLACAVSAKPSGLEYRCDGIPS